jgi:hypothetical protein
MLGSPARYQCRAYAELGGLQVADWVVNVVICRAPERALREGSAPNLSLCSKKCRNPAHKLSFGGGPRRSNQIPEVVSVSGLHLQVELRGLEPLTPHCQERARAVTRRFYGRFPSVGAVFDGATVVTVVVKIVVIGKVP